MVLQNSDNIVFQAEPHHSKFRMPPLQDTTCRAKRWGWRKIQKNADKAFAKLENFGPRDFYFQILEFCACNYNTLVVNSVNQTKGQVCNYSGPKGKEFSTNGALPGLQRGARHVATACLLRRNGRPVATPGGPYGKTATIFRRKNGAEIGKSAQQTRFFETPEIQNYQDKTRRFQVFCEGDRRVSPNVRKTMYVTTCQRVRRKTTCPNNRCGTTDERRPGHKKSGSPRLRDHILESKTSEPDFYVKISSA